MRHPHRVFVALLVCPAVLAGFTQEVFGQATSKWVQYDRHGRLQYAADDAGNRIMDYSWAGYRGGGVSLPSVAARVTVSPSGKDDTAAIQSAIDTVSARRADRKGFRGAVRLARGIFNISAPLRVSTSGVVLAGSGSSPDGSVLKMSGSPFTLVVVSGSGSYARGPAARMTDAYVPSGATTFAVSDTSAFKVGDNILISHPVTAAWVSFMGMDQLTRYGKPQTWLAVGSQILTDRSITAIRGGRITIDVPLSDSFDATYLDPPGGSVAAYTFPERISNVAVEHLSITAPAREINGTQYQAVTLNNVMNGWLRDLNVRDTQNSITLTETTRQITVDAVHVTHSYRQGNAAAPTDFALSGTQVLSNNCSVTGGGNTWPFVTHARAAGPIVVLKGFADDRGFGPHQRWATGLLCDLCNFPTAYKQDKAGVAYSNRGYFGSGHGWDAGWSVAWNVTSPYFLIQAPPGTLNWCIGCIGTAYSESAPGGDGTVLPNGIYDSPGTAVKPGSLYLAQLKERLGIAALKNIGYADTDGTPLALTSSRRPLAAAR
jgi:hypothetical protein